MKTLKKRYGSSEFLQSKNSVKGLVKTTAEKLNSLRTEKFERQGRDTRQRHSGTEEQTRHRIATGAQPLLTKPATWVCNDDTSVPVGSCLAELVEASRRSKRILVSGEESRNNVRRNAAFTLVELVIVIAIVIVLSVVSVPIYRSYVDKAKWTEAHALLGMILSAQKAYYSEFGNFLKKEDSSGVTSYDTVLGIDARGNKYFSKFYVNGSGSSGKEKYRFDAGAYNENFRQDGKKLIQLTFNLTEGSTVNEWLN